MISDRARVASHRFYLRFLHRKTERQILDDFADLEQLGIFDEDSYSHIIQHCAAGKLIEYDRDTSAAPSASDWRWSNSWATE